MAAKMLPVKQAQALLNAPDISTTKGLRDRAIIAVLLGCGLRRSEVSALTVPRNRESDTSRTENNAKLAADRPREPIRSFARVDKSVHLPVRSSDCRNLRACQTTGL